jgi:hypothetical protein
MLKPKTEPTKPIEPEATEDLTTQHGTKLHTVTYADGVLVIKRRSDSAVVVRQKMPRSAIPSFMAGFRSTLEQ